MKKTILIALLAVLSVSSSFSSASQSVTEQHSQLFKDYLALFNDSNEAGLKAFVVRHVASSKQGPPPDAIVKSEMNLRQVSGGLDLVHTQTNTPTQLTCIVKGRGEFPQFVRVDWVFDDADSSMVLERHLVPIDVPKDQLPPRLSSDKLAKELDARLTSLASKDGFSGGSDWQGLQGSVGKGLRLLRPGSEDSEYGR